MTNSKDHDDQLFHLAKDFMDKIADGSINRSEAAAFLRAERTATRPSVPVANQLSAWNKLFDAMECDCDLSEVAIPQYRPGFDRLIMVPNTISLTLVAERMGRWFDVWMNPDFGTDLESAVPQNQRSNGTTYAIWTRDRVEADSDLKAMSAADVEAQNIQTMTLLERLLFEMLRFHQNRDHLDIIGGTLCAGSRTTDGKVPCVEWSEEDCQVGITVGALRRQSPLTCGREIAD